MRVNIIILNYNGEKLIPECLPSIIESKKYSTNEVTITVIDNESTDGSLDVLKLFESEIDIIKHENRVFCSFNTVCSQIKDDIVILLNNDIKVDNKFIDPLVKVFEEKEDAFLVGPKVFTFDGKRYEGTLSRWRIEAGVIKTESRFDGYEKLIDKPGLIAQAGFGAFDREKVVKLGGFDDIYLPGIMEDADLCFRAWKKGYRCYYEPKSLMLHKSQAAFKNKFKMRDILKMSHRNTYLFMWKNIKDKNILIKSCFWIIPRCLRAILKCKFEIVFGFLGALLRLPVALKRRNSENTFFTRTDREVLEYFNVN